MGRNYDNWGRLVEAVIRREEIRGLFFADSRSPSITSIDSDYSISSRSGQDNLSSRTSPSSDQVKLAQSVKEGKQSGSEKVPAKRRNAIWKGLSIFGGFSSKKDNGREERELQWAAAQTTLHGLEPVKTIGVCSKQNYEEVSLTTKRKAEIARLRELQTLKGHIESHAKIRGLDIDSIHLYYTV